MNALYRTLSHCISHPTHVLVELLLHLLRLTPARNLRLGALHLHVLGHFPLRSVWSLGSLGCIAVTPRNDDNGGHFRVQGQDFHSGPLELRTWKALSYLLRIKEFPWPRSTPSLHTPTSRETSPLCPVKLYCPDNRTVRNWLLALLREHGPHRVLFTLPVCCLNPVACSERL